MQPAAPSSQTQIADTLSRFAAEFDLDAVDERTREQARLRILDAAGIALAATGYEFAHRALTALSSFGAGDSEVIGMPAKLALRDAVLMNGILVHGIDYDDTYLPGGVHVTASSFPCALAMAARGGKSGRELLAAYILGTEATIRISAVARGELHQIGFHPTGLVAAFGCSLIAGRLIGLNAEQLSMAQGIVLSTAPISSRQYNQSAAWSKRIHPGWAGTAGITAAVMAQQGFIGARGVYEGKYGFFRMHLQQRAAEFDLTPITQDLGRVWELHNVAIKPYPIGQMGVAHLGCAIALNRAHGIHPDQVRSIRALVPKEAIPIMCEPVEFRRRPATGYAAQFSIPYAIACGLARGRFSLSELEEPTLSDPDVLGLAAKVEHEVDPKSEYPKYYSGEVIVTTTDGRELRQREHVTHGAADNPVSAGQIGIKFMENAGRVMARSRAEKLRELILDIEALPDARVLARALSGGAP